MSERGMSERLGEIEARLGYLETDRETLLEVVGLRIGSVVDETAVRMKAMEAGLKRSVEAAAGMDTASLAALVATLDQVQGTATEINELCSRLETRIASIQADERQLSATELDDCVDTVLEAVKETHRLSAGGCS